MAARKISSCRASERKTDANAPECGGIVKGKRVTTGYKKWIAELKERYRATQIKAAISVNSALIEFYWNLGKDISEKYPGKKRGIDFFGTLSRDLNDGQPYSGLSVANIRYAHRFYDVYASYLQQLAERMTHVPWGQHMLIPIMKSRRYCRHRRNSRSATPMQRRRTEIVQAPLAQLPWYHHLALLEQLKSRGDRIAYAALAVENGWSRDVMVHQIDMKVADQHGKAVSIVVGGDEFEMDLLFYHVVLHRYVVIELKTRKFRPQDLGQLSFYMTAIDRQVKSKADGKTIGLVLCKSRNDLVVEYALSDIHRPIGVSTYQLGLPPPDQLQAKLQKLLSAPGNAKKRKAAK